VGARLTQGEKFKLKEFHNLLWENGNVPIALQRWEYLGRDDEARKLWQVLPERPKLMSGQAEIRLQLPQFRRFWRPCPRVV
jgi:hypothetical protein